MNEKMILSGMGGQGIISLGYLLVNAAMNEDKFVSLIPSYGAEMRGGISNSFITISDSTIFSPVVAEADTVILMYDPSLKIFESKIKKSGVAILNKDAISNFPKRDDIKIIWVNANEEAQKIGNIKIANVIMAGIWCGYKKLISKDSIINQIKDVFKNKNQKMIDLNLTALDYGYNLGVNA